MSQEIPLTRGYVAIVDDGDYEDLAKHKWCALQAGRRIYAVRRSPNAEIGGPRMVLMHRVVIGAEVDQDADHISGDTLDNRRTNLRACVPAQNACNRGPNANNTSGYKGVSWRPNRGKYRATINVNRKQVHLGHFDTPEDAARAYDAAAIRLHGDFARLNFPVN